MKLSGHRSGQEKEAVETQELSGTQKRSRDRSCQEKKAVETQELSGTQKRSRDKAARRKKLSRLRSCQEYKSAHKTGSATGKRSCRGTGAVMNT